MGDLEYSSAAQEFGDGSWYYDSEKGYDECMFCSNSSPSEAYRQRDLV